MMIPSILTGLTDLSTLGKRNDTPDAKTATATAAPPADAGQQLAPTTAVREILAQYDVTDISPNDFSRLLQQLQDKGGISQKDLQELSSIRVDLENSGVGPDESINLLDFYRRQIANAQSQSSGASNGADLANVEPLVQRLKWMEKFAAVHEQRGQPGLNAVA